MCSLRPRQELFQLGFPEFGVSRIAGELIISVAWIWDAGVFRTATRLARSQTHLYRRDDVGEEP